MRSGRSAISSDQNPSDSGRPIPYHFHVITQHATVRNAHGIHCRPSAVIVKESAKFASTLRISCASGEANPKSIIAVIALGLAEGDTVTITASGPDEKEACRRLAELIATHFDFPPREDGQTDTQVLDGPATS